MSCWLCGNDEAVLKKKGLSPKDLTTANFAITNIHYGKTLDIYQCTRCTYLFCPDAKDVVGFYEDLEDNDYESIRGARMKQAASLVNHTLKYKKGGTFLDVGAASGILVEQALQHGYQAQGIEPSEWLCKQAGKSGLPVIQGIFPHASLTGKYDVITLIDVVEHVTDPLQLLKDIAAQLSPDGITAIGTPDVGSAVARLMGWKWYQFRVGHISYFDRTTLDLACRNAGLVPIKWYRPMWYFPFDFLWQRLASYLPFTRYLNRFAPSFTIPFNLGDNWMVIAKRQQTQ